MKIPNFVRYLNKRFLNRVMMRSAGKKSSPFAVFTHTGRRSGKSYRVPLLLAEFPDGFAFALTYGRDVDWVKNLFAAGTGMLRWHAREYNLSDPRFVDREIGRKRFPNPQKTVLGWFGIECFLQVQAEQIEEGD